MAFPAFGDFFSGKTILITGHTGFKGSWLSIWLRELGANVIGYSLDPPTVPSLFGICGLAAKVESVHGDVRDLDSLLEVTDRYRPEMVFHLAAQSLVRRSYRNPIETFETNVMGTVNVLEAGRQTPSVRIIINVTSDKCYENNEWIWPYREIDPLGGHDPYSSSKGCAELVTRAYARSYFLAETGQRPQKALASVRAGNVIGGGDWAEDRLLPDCIRALTGKKPLTLRNPHAVRPWQHVLDPLCGYMLLAHKMSAEPVDFSEPWNFGSNDESFITVREMAEHVMSEWGEGTCDAFADPSQPEARVLKLDSSKAITRLNWRPRWNVRTAISKTVEWYKSYLAGDDMVEVSKRQIAAYSDGH